MESTFLEIFPDDKKSNCIIGCLYKHPNFSTEDFNSNYMNPLLEKINNEGKKIILMGDFNINLMKEGTDRHVDDFIDILGANLILPTILIPTRVTPKTQTLIDNIFASPFDQEIQTGNITIGISDHLPQFLILQSNHELSKNSDIYYRDWNVFEEKEFTLKFYDNNWDDTLKLQNRDPDLSFNNFYSKILELIELHAPLKKLTRKQKLNKRKPWITKGIRKSIQHRNKLLNLFVKSKDIHSKENYHKNYKYFRNQIVNLIRISKDNHYKNFFTKNIQNSKNIWKGINELININKSNDISNILLNVNNKVVTDPIITSSIFNNYFTTIADDIRKTIPKTKNKYFKDFLHNSPQNSFFFNAITNNEVIRTIKSLDPNKSSGPNNIPNKILNLLLIDISDILTKIFNLSFETGKFISLLKIAKVIPIFKNKGSDSDVTNYRPISLLSNIDKIFEKLVYSRISSFLTDHNLINNKQFGFRSKHSTTHALISITEKIRYAIDNNEFACGIFIDLQKAFDTVDHHILLKKLQHYGIRGIANSWFKSYLSNRKQSVCISGYFSELKTILHGVPQGSVLGPLLFLLYINDLPNAISNSDTFLFADDTGLFFCNKDLKVMEYKVNQDLNSLVSWLNVNKIALNIAKTEIVLFRSPRKKLFYKVKLSLNGQTVKLSSTVKYLGIILDEHMSWKSHLTSLAQKLSRANGILSKLRHVLPKQSLLTVYYALFQSHLSYANQVWGQALSHKSRIFKLQKASIRILTFSKYFAHSKPLFQSLNILTVHNLTFSNNIILIYQILNKNSPLEIQSSFNLKYISNSHSTRGCTNKLLAKPKVKTTNYGLNSIIYQSISNWNTLQNYFFGIDLSNITLFKLKHLTLAYLNSIR